MDPKNIKKEYSNGEITIVWESAKCIHSGNCVRNNPDVFKPRQQPWINPEHQDSEKIKSTVEKCPSGALSFYWNQK